MVELFYQVEQLFMYMMYQVDLLTYQEVEEAQEVEAQEVELLHVIFQ
jgi:hypothetical protein